MVPSIKDCLRLMKRYSMLENIQRHSIVVAKVAFVIGSGLVESGEKISMDKVIAGALLHDIGKTESLKTKRDHVEIGVGICKENGLDEIIEIISEHVILKSFDPLSSCSEKEVVYYSDKRVNHDRVVTLKERLIYIIDRYGKGKEEIEAIKENFRLCEKVEKKLFRKLPFNPDDLERFVKRVDFDPDKGLIGWKK